jgi:pimeloyl-ACP methyl ester carboxylesterase
MTTVPSVLFIPGLACPPRVWQPLVDSLSADIRPLLLDAYHDARGQVLTRFEQMAQHLAQQLAAVLRAPPFPGAPERVPQTAPVHLVTHSMGALVALHLLPLLPAPPASLFLCAPVGLTTATALPPGDFSGLDTGQLIFHLVRRSFSREFLHAQGALMRDLFAAGSSEWKNPMSGQLGAIHHLRPLQPLPPLPPTMVLVAEDDLVVPPEVSRTVAATLSARVESLAGARAHGFIVEQAQEVALRLRAWWQALL